jgi:hypothetical protein
VILVHNDVPGILCDQSEWYPLQRLNSVPRHRLEIQSTPPNGHPALISALEPILIGITTWSGYDLQNVIDEMTHGTHFKLVNLFHATNANLTHEDPNTSIDEPENRWNINLVSYDTVISRAKPSSNGQLSCFAWSVEIFNEFHRYKTKNSTGWQTAINVTIQFKLQVPASPGFYSLYDWGFQTMSLFSSVPEDPEDDTVMDKHHQQQLGFPSETPGGSGRL